MEGECSETYVFADSVLLDLKLAHVERGNTCSLNLGSKKECKWSVGFVHAFRHEAPTMLRSTALLVYLVQVVTLSCYAVWRLWWVENVLPSVHILPPKKETYKDVGTSCESTGWYAH